MDSFRFMLIAVISMAAFFAADCAPVRKTAAKPRPAATQAVKNNQGRYRRSPYVSAMALDADTGRVLFADNIDKTAYPASVTKLMTAFLVLDDVKSGKLTLQDKVVASPVKTRRDIHLRQPSQIGLKAGESMSVDELLSVLMVKSANDAAVFLAEKCSGSMDAFVKRMNEKALSLGMKSTKYYNPNGLHPMPGLKGDSFNVSTCRDLAKMSIALLKTHPEILRYTSQKVYEATLPNGKKIKFKNHNNVMRQDKYKIINPDGSEAVDGLKTGYIDAGGSSIVLTGKRNGKRAMVIVLGSSSAAERDVAAKARLEDALGALAW